MIRSFFMTFLALTAFVNISNACTNFIVTKGASTRGSCMITYSADSHVLYGELYHWSAATHPKGSMLDIYEWDTGKRLGQIKQADKTYNVVGNMNEKQVAIGETTFGGREELIDTNGIMDYGSLIYIALQRAGTAREAIKIMTDLVAEYGYYSSGESFSIADPNEAWIMEMIGKGPGNKGALWVAIRIPDGYISGHANHARITTFPFQKSNDWSNTAQDVYHSADVVSFAKSNGWFTGADKDFSFSDIYAPIDFGGARACEARVWSGFNKVNSEMGKYLDYAMGQNLNNRMPLYIKPDRKLSLEDVYDLMRDYYQNTPMDMTKDIGAGPYKCIVRWRPMNWKVDGVTYFNERAISTQQTGFSFVAESRPDVPAPLGGIIWWGVDDTYTTVYTPIYTCSTRVPETMARGFGSMMEFNPDAAFWVFNQVSNYAYTRFSDMIVDIQKKQKELESDYITKVPSIDQQAAALYKKSPRKAVAFLTDWSAEQGNKTTTEWKKLYGFLFAKYMDGNVKSPSGEQNPHLKQPGYGEEFYREIIRETGDKFKVIGPAHH